MKKLISPIRFILLLPTFIFIMVIYIINIFRAWKSGYITPEMNYKIYVTKVLDEIITKISKYFIHISIITWIIILFFILN